MDTEIKRAILSVSDKSGLIDFAKFLASYEIDLISTGGTATAMRDAGLKVTDVSEYTGFPEMMGGRVKTLHPKVHGGLLAVRDNAEHRAALEAHQIKPVDLLVVNLYPFEKAISDPNVTTEAAIENIDIGGPAMIRSASKNYKSVTVVVEPSQYGAVVNEMEGTCVTTEYLRERLMVEAFDMTAKYDRLISDYFGNLFRHDYITRRFGRQGIGNSAKQP